MNAGACLGELFALAVLAATPACSDRVEVAKISDAGLDAMPITACGNLDGGMVGCPDGSFCSLNSCPMTPSSPQGSGTCHTIPSADSCADAGFALECDCRGVTYFNECLRLASSVSLYKMSACLDIPDPTTIRFPKACSLTDKSMPCDRGETCLPPSFPFPAILREAGLTPEQCPFKAPQFIGYCWVLPKNCSHTGTGLRPCGTDSCGDACDVLKNGGAYFTCPP
jgi:hypothetical protein